MTHRNIIKENSFLTSYLLLWGVHHGIHKGDESSQADSQRCFPVMFCILIYMSLGSNCPKCFDPRFFFKSENNKASRSTISSSISSVCAKFLGFLKRTCSVTIISWSRTTKTTFHKNPIVFFVLTLLITKINNTVASWVYWSTPVWCFSSLPRDAYLSPLWILQARVYFKFKLL